MAINKVVLGLLALVLMGLDCQWYNKKYSNSDLYNKEYYEIKFPLVVSEGEFFCQKRFVFDK